MTLTLALAGMAGATSCKADCEGEDCNGDCTINGGICRTACISDGCPGTAICKEYGDSTMCFHEFTSTCSKSGSEELPPTPEQQFRSVGSLQQAVTEWSVVGYQGDELAGLAFDQVEVLASTSSAFADRTVDELISRQRDDAAALRRRFRVDGWKIEARPFGRRLRYSVDPAGECVRVGMELASTQLSNAGEATIFLRATVDGEGDLAAAEVLHSTEPGAGRRMVDFLRGNARLWREDGGDGPFDAFIVFFTRQDDSVGWIVSGSRPLF